MRAWEYFSSLMLTFKAFKFMLFGEDREWKLQNGSYQSMPVPWPMGMWDQRNSPWATTTRSTATIMMATAAMAMRTQVMVATTVMVTMQGDLGLLTKTPNNANPGPSCTDDNSQVRPGFLFHTLASTDS
jgi:hypothetical protein